MLHFVSMKRMLVIACCGFLLAVIQIGAACADDARAALPPGVDETVPTGVTSLQLVQLRLGPKGSPILVHIWTAARYNPLLNGAKQTSGPKRISRTEMLKGVRFQLSPICVDIFMPTREPNTWHLVNTVIWSATEAPKEVQARWLQPKRKRGPVLLIRSGIPGITRWTVLTFPDGLDAGPYTRTRSSVQTFMRSGSSGGAQRPRFDRVDKRGFLMVQYEMSGSGPPYMIPHRWNGSAFVAGRAYVTSR